MTDEYKAHFLADERDQVDARSVARVARWTAKKGERAALFILKGDVMVKNPNNPESLVKLSDRLFVSGDRAVLWLRMWDRWLDEVNALPRIDMSEAEIALELEHATNRTAEDEETGEAIANTCRSGVDKTTVEISADGTNGWAMCKCGRGRFKIARSRNQGWRFVAAHKPRAALVAEQTR